jgi:hypothetical protein
MVAGRVFAVLWAFLRVVLEKVVRRRGVFCGEVVVNCMANVDKKPLFSAAEKWDTIFNFIFRQGGGGVGLRAG